MAEEYDVQRTSRQSAVVSDKVLSETDTTRLVLRAVIVDNPHSLDATVKVALVHQRKSPTGEWEDAPTWPLSKLKAGEEVKLSLHSEPTLRLFRELGSLYAIATKGEIGLGKTTLVVGREEEIIRTDTGRANVIKLLLEKGYSDDIWNALIAENPDLATRLSYARIHTKRKASLDEFSANLGQNRGEGWWQSFFENNTWIFGFGLRYQFLESFQTQPHFGGQAMSGRGAEKGDFLQHTAAQVRFTVLIEIKKPDSMLLAAKPYRNAAWQLGEDLTGGVAQLQANCRRWETEGSRIETNRETLSKEGLLTVQPRGILVIGHTAQLDEISKKTTFELFRRNLVNPEILTFDELFERAKFIVEHTAESQQSAGDEQTDGTSTIDGADIPF